MSEHDEGLCGGNHSSLSPRQRAERWLNKHYGYWPLSNKERDSLTAEIEAAVAEATEGIHDPTLHTLCLCLWGEGYELPDTGSPHMLDRVVVRIRSERP